jgi:hypothetical protein
MRFWNELVADVADPIPGGVPGLAMGLILLTSLIAALWYWWPRWLPAGRRGAARGRLRRGWRLRPLLRRWWRALRWSRWRARLRWRPRWRLPRPRRRRAAVPHLDLPPDQLPDVPAAVMELSADELAAQGRYREAVRQRLRAIVRDLVERQVVEHHPGWTVTELARMAGAARPATATPLAVACDVFSRIWYGQRPASADDDAAMRKSAAEVRAFLNGEPDRRGVDTIRMPA